MLIYVMICFYYRGTLGTVLTSMAVLWCSFSASKLFVSALQMDGQQLLVSKRNVSIRQRVAHCIFCYQFYR